MRGRRLILVMAMVAGGIVTWSAVKGGHAPYPSQFVGVGVVYTVASLLGEASPELGTILALAATLGIAYAAVGAKSNVVPLSAQLQRGAPFATPAGSKAA